MHRIDLNCDLGEGAPNDDALLDVVTSANVACGAHAGDAGTMRTTVAAAKLRGVAVGAHPGFPDRENFGRHPMSMTATEIHDLVVDQVRALQAITDASDIPLQHVKAHGALYNLAATDRGVAEAIVGAVVDCDPTLVLFALAGSELIAAGEAAGLRTAAEAFADRTYEADGTLTPRSEASAVIRELDRALTQVIRLATERKATTRAGGEITVVSETICIHGDKPEAPEFARAIRAGLESAGIEVKSVST